MPRPETHGRMINKDISDDEGFAKLSPSAAVLFCMLIPHFNSYGKQSGGPGYIKDEICPRIPYLTVDNLPVFLREISNNTSVKWFENRGRYWIHSIKFLTKHQNLRRDKLGADLLPDYSRTTPVPVQTKPARLIKEEEEEKNKAKASPGLTPPVDNQEDNPPFPAPPPRKEALEKKEEPKPVSKNTHGERWNGKRGNELDELMQDIRSRYGAKYHQLCLVFVQTNYNRCNPNAMLHCLRSLISKRMAGESIPLPGRYLESALNGNGKQAGENGKHEAAESEKEAEQFKGMTKLSDLIPKEIRTSS